MNLKFIEKEIEDNHGEYIISAEKEGWGKYINDAKNTLIKNLVVPGFRKGHIPSNVAQKHISPKAIVSSALNKFIDDSYKFVNSKTDRKILPFNFQLIELKVEDVSEDKVVIKFIFPMKPHIDVSSWDKLTMNFKDIKTNITLETALKNHEEALLNQKTEHVLIEDKNHKIQQNDVAIIDFEGKIDDKVFEGGAAKKFSLIIGSNQFIPGFEDQLIGMKIEEEKDVHVTFPKDYHAKNFAGKKAVFHVYLHEIKSTSKPKLDDKFISSLNLENIKTLEQWKEQTLKKLKEDQAKELLNLKEELLLTELIEKLPIKVSQKIVNKNFEHAKTNFYNRINELKVPKEMVFAQMGKTEEEAIEQIKEDSLNQLKLSIIIGEIAEVLKISKDKSIYDEWLKNTSKETKSSIEDLKKQVPLSIEVISRIRNELTWNEIKKHYIK